MGRDYFFTKTEFCGAVPRGGVVRCQEKSHPRQSGTRGHRWVDAVDAIAARVVGALGFQRIDEQLIDDQMGSSSMKGRDEAAKRQVRQTRKEMEGLSWARNIAIINEMSRQGAEPR